MPETQTGEKRTRAKAEYIVEIAMAPDPGATERRCLMWSMVGEHGRVKDTVAGERWIKKCGVEKDTYRVVRVCLPATTVQIEKVEKRTLT